MNINLNESQKKEMEKNIDENKENNSLSGGNKIFQCALFIY
jgi:hypothetical protein